MSYLKKYSELIYICILIIICFLLYFTNISNYPFIDTDETKYVSIAKDMLNYNDWINIRLNGEDIYDCQPLFFWITNLSCLIFGKISADAVRLPVSVFGITGVIILFFSIKNILTRLYAFIIALIMAVCFGVIIFSRLATNDLLFVFTTMTTILFSYLVIFEKREKNKLLLWIFIYFFSALSVLSSGIFGILIPFCSITAMHIFSGKFKELLLPKNLILGLTVFLILTLPWNLIMIHKHGLLFLKENLALYNFLNYAGIKQYISVFCLFFIGFLPWLFSFIWILGSKFKDIIFSIFSYFKDNSQKKLKEKWHKLKKIDKFLSLNTIVFFTALIFAVLYGAKYTYLILFLMFPASCISGYYWYQYIIKKQHDKSIFFATMIPNLILIICSLAGLFGHNVINKLIFQGLNHLIIPLIIIFFVIPLTGIFAAILKGRVLVFVSNIILMISLSFVITPSIFNFISINGGENDLINFAQMANKDKTVLTAFIPSKKYSLIYYYDKYVNFHDNKDIEWLKTYLKENPNAYVVVELKDLWTIEENKIKYILLDSGKRYCLIQHMAFEYKEEDNTEPEVVIY